ncbi:NAD(P)/FAD-dependent oxidoreductase [Rubrivirga sp. S365]|uniref:NADH:ubiquinone reductase (non-electrogenic) n=1 Tax=Rubrivirga litoralis TaxID=3075598 RepID=A0ABU3BUC8_9BACT|nr:MULTISPECIES: NAD(P)/FAD-dependent oxidoreductase [unclassified Rubrivirga]MDT0632898.1 NAD(P)/FAD-dependent oxidoreductase [Rubrivirga sp. F394]MDT7857448.1 NAD(P)/FAD-dependent oxidoreductase [Rubrivirga sp. S365]
MPPRPAPPGTRPRVVVVGAGHGGIECVKALGDAAVEVLVVDRNNYNKFQPLLYQVATAGLDVDDITQPIRHIVRRQANTDVLLGLVVDVDFEAKRVLLDGGGAVDYDVLVLAPGASTTYYGVEGAEEHAFPLKNIDDAVSLRSHMLRQFEAASADPSLVGNGVLTTVVVGGGPTGVEMTGAIRELTHVLAKDFPHLDVSRARVVLVDGDRAPLSGYAPELREYTVEALEKKGAEFRFGTHVERVDVDGVDLQDGGRIDATTVIWAAGVQANPLVDALGLEQTKGGRVVVDATLRVPGRPDVFVIGDSAGASDAEGNLYPGVAQVAIQQGKHVARLVEAAASGAASDEPFVYHDLGQMATIGRNAAVLQMPSGLRMTGFLAWVGWLLVHVVHLVGFRNRTAVLFNWAYNYVAYDRGPRLILTAEPDPARPARPVLSTAPTVDVAAPPIGGSRDPRLG